MGSKYKRVIDAEPFEINYKERVLHMACCDCGLVHEMVFNVDDSGKLFMSTKRLDRQTAQLRKNSFGDLHEENFNKNTSDWKLVRKDN